MLLYLPVCSLFETLLYEYVERTRIISNRFLVSFRVFFVCLFCFILNDQNESAFSDLVWKKSTNKKFNSFE